MNAGSVGQGPADHGHGEDQQEHSGANDAQGSTVAQQVVAGFGINAENNGDNRYHAPGQQDGTPWCRPIIAKNCAGGWPAGIHQGSSGATPAASENVKSLRVNQPLTFGRASFQTK